MEHLFQFWNEINDRFSLENIKDLQNQKYIPFIGSGMSVPFGYKVWNQFLLSIIDEYFDSSDQERIELDNLLSNNEYLLLAEKINIVLNDGITEEVRRGFNRNLMKSVSIESNYIQLLCSMGIKTFITTNYDCVIEDNAKITPDKIYIPSNLIKPEDVIDAIRTDKGGVIKLHGTFDRHESIILTKSAFDRVYNEKNTALKEIVDYIWKTSVLLFLGCGLTKDYLIERMLKLAGTGKSNWHYAVLAYPENDAKKVKLELAKLKIRPIWFENGKFEQIQTILKMIANIEEPGTDMRIPTKKSVNNPSKTKVRNSNGQTKEKICHVPAEKLKYLDHLAAQVKDDPKLQKTLADAILTQCIEPTQYSKKNDIFMILLNNILTSKSNYPLSIIGEPGTGKSTLLSLLFYRCLQTRPDINAFLIDTHYYDHQLRKDACEDLKQHLETIGNNFSAAKSLTLIFIDGINRFDRGDRSLENIIVRWVNKYKDQKGIKFILAIGVLDETLFPPFKHVSEKQPFGNTCENTIILRPVGNLEAKQSQLVMAVLRYFTAVNKTKLINIQSHEDRLCHYCKKAGGSSTDFRTVNFVLKLLSSASSVDEFFRADIGSSFNKYFHMINTEETMLATAKYTALSLLQKEPRRTPKGKFYYLFKSEAIRNFFFAYYYVDLLKKCDVSDLALFDCIFTPGINRFIVDLMLNQPDQGKDIIENICWLMEESNTTMNQKNQMAFLLGRVTNKACKEIAITILSKKYREWDWQKRMTTAESMYIRTVGISLIYLGCTIYASDFYEKLIYNRSLSRINRNFHIHYFITTGYCFNSKLKLDDNEMCSSKNIDDLYQYLYHSIFDKSSRIESMCINIITILNLTVYKIFYLGKNDTFNIQKAQNLISALLSEKVELPNQIVLEYVQNIKEFIDKGNIYISTLSNIYKLKDVQRTGWLTRGVDKRQRTESVADHTWACCQLALLFLPENLEDCGLAEQSELSIAGGEYSLSKILQMLIIHDLGEVCTGDILTAKKSVDDEKRESNFFRNLVTLDTLPHFSTFGYIENLAKEFNEHNTYNAKLAKDIDLMEPLIQLFIYRQSLDSYTEDRGMGERDSWIKGVETKLSTALGKNLLRFLESQILCYF